MFFFQRCNCIVKENASARSDQNKDIEEAFTYLPTCLDAFSKNFVLEATLQAKKRTEMLVTIILL